jgi:predicted hydrocarbon binding protein
VDANPYFRFDPQSKHIEDAVFGCRGIIINERFWNRIRGELLDLMKESGPILLYQLGLSYGFEVGARGKDIVNDPQAAIKFLEYYGLLAGWGRFETGELRMSRGDIEGGMTVRVWDSFFASATKSETGNPGCFFVSGLLAGIADGLFGQSHNCMEKECRSAGSECCEFVVTAV